MAGSTLAIAIGMTVAALAAPIQADSLVGKWIGEAKFNGPMRKAFLHCAAENAVMRGHIDIPFAGPTTLRREALSEIATDGSNVSFVVKLRDWDELRFNGRLEGDLFEGDLTQGDDRSSFYFVRVEDVDTAQLSTYTGWYESESGTRGWLAVKPEGGLSYLDSKNMEGMTLFPVGMDRFLEWTGEPPFDSMVEFQRDASGTIERFVVREGGKEKRTATRVSGGPFGQNAVTFNNDNVTLAGLLLLPRGEGPFPAVIVVHGAGYGTRERARELLIAESLLAKNVAVLTYDKRGCGLSSGDWTTASYEDLAADALAAVDLLRSRAEIQASAVGLYGHSQGGMIVPIAAARSAHVAFVINESGSTVPLAEAELYQSEIIYKKNGVRDADLREAMDYTRLRLGAFLDPAKWPEYLAALERNRQKPWFAFSGFSPTASPNDPAVKALREQMSFDGMIWYSIRVPALHLYGSADQLVPVDACVKRLQEVEASRKLSNWTYKVFPGAGHGCHASPYWPEDFLEALAQWTLSVTREIKDKKTTADKDD